MNTTTINIHTLTIKEKAELAYLLTEQIINESQNPAFIAKSSKNKQASDFLSVFGENHLDSADTLRDFVKDAM